MTILEGIRISNLKGNSVLKQNRVTVPDTRNVIPFRQYTHFFYYKWTMNFGIHFPLNVSVFKLLAFYNIAFASP